MTSLKSLLEQSQDVEKIARDYATAPLGFSGRDHFDEKEYIDFSAGYNSRDAEVEKLKRVILVMEEALEFYGDKDKYFMRKRVINLQQTTAIFKVDKPEDLPTEYESEIFECSARLKVEQGKTAKEALTKAREILGGGENGK